MGTRSFICFLFLQIVYVLARIKQSYVAFLSQSEGERTLATLSLQSNRYNYNALGEDAQLL